MSSWVSALVSALAAGMPTLRTLTEELAAGVHWGFPGHDNNCDRIFPQSAPRGVAPGAGASATHYALFIIIGIVAALLIGDRRWEHAAASAA